MRRCALRVLLSAVLFGGGVTFFARSPSLTSAAPSPAVSSAALTPAEDSDPDPNVVEVRLVAKESSVEFLPGRPTRVWAYNGSVPGPAITAKVGDHVAVRFTNELPEPTTIHWHGVEVPAEMDGSNTSQEPIAPGGEFRYRFEPQTAATYWYHSHIATAEQVERGLYGALVVRSPAEDRHLGLPEAEMTLVLDDILLDEQGGFAPFATDPTSSMPPEERARQLADGREGNHLLVNGKIAPTFEVVSGQPLRWRMVNVANGRFMRLSVPGQTMYRIGGDAGLIDRPLPVRMVSMVSDPADPARRISEPNADSGLIVVPGERAEVVITPRGDPGEEIEVQWHDSPRGRHAVTTAPDGTFEYGHNVNDGKTQPEVLFRLRVTAATAKYREYVPPSPLRPVEPLDVGDAPTVAIPFGHTDPDRMGNSVFFNALKGQVPIPFGKLTSADAPDIEVGKTYILAVENRTKMDHPVHLHGFFFQPLEVEYVDPDNPRANRVLPFLGRENKDTIRLPAAPGAHEGSGAKTILRLAVQFDEEGREGAVEAFGKTPVDGKSGGWVLHCHNLEHADQGMMTFLELRDGDD